MSAQQPSSEKPVIPQFCRLLTLSTGFVSYILNKTSAAARFLACCLECALAIPRSSPCRCTRQLYIGQKMITVSGLLSGVGHSHTDLQVCTTAVCRTESDQCQWPVVWSGPWPCPDLQVYTTAVHRTENDQCQWPVVWSGPWPCPDLQVYMTAGCWTENDHCQWPVV